MSANDPTLITEAELAAIQTFAGTVGLVSNNYQTGRIIMGLAYMEKTKEVLETVAGMMRGLNDKQKSDPLYRRAQEILKDTQPELFNLLIKAAEKPAMVEVAPEPVAESVVETEAVPEPDLKAPTGERLPRMREDVRDTKENRMVYIIGLLKQELRGHSRARANQYQVSSIPILRNPSMEGVASLVSQYFTDTERKSERVTSLVAVLEKDFPGLKAEIARQIDELSEIAPTDEAPAPPSRTEVSLRGISEETLMDVSEQESVVEAPPPPKAPITPNDRKIFDGLSEVEVDQDVDALEAAALKDLKKLMMEESVVEDSEEATQEGATFPSDFGEEVKFTPEEVEAMRVEMATIVLEDLADKPSQDIPSKQPEVTTVAESTSNSKVESAAPPAASGFLNQVTSAIGAGFRWLRDNVGAPIGKFVSAFVSPPDDRQSILEQQEREEELEMPEVGTVVPKFKTVIEENIPDPKKRESTQFKMSEVEDEIQALSEEVASRVEQAHSTVDEPDSYDEAAELLLEDIFSDIADEPKAAEGKVNKEFDKSLADANRQPSPTNAPQPRPRADVQVEAHLTSRYKDLIRALREYKNELQERKENIPKQSEEARKLRHRSLEASKIINQLSRNPDMLTPKVLLESCQKQFQDATSKTFIKQLSLDAKGSILGQSQSQKVEQLFKAEIEKLKTESKTRSQSTPKAPGPGNRGGV